MLEIMFENTKNPIEIMKINREHIIALQEAFTHTNKKKCLKRANRLLELLNILKQFDKKRNQLHWED